MPYVHLANGEVMKVSKKEFATLTDESGTPNAIQKDGFEHQVIGVYPEENQLAGESE
jgi:hypothetical protein